jgi:glycosyltransferase involved in cell wall biosynthesis
VVQVHNTQNYISLRVLDSLRAHFPKTPIVLTLHDYSLFCKGALRCKSASPPSIGSTTKLPGKLTCALCQKHTFNPLKTELAARTINRSATAVIYVSQFLRRFYEENGVRVPGQVIYNGAIMPIFDAEPRAAMPIPARMHIVCGGRAVSRKGFALPIEALKHLPLEHQQRIHLTIFGLSDALISELKEISDFRSIAAHIDLLGWLPRTQIDALLRSAHLAIVPSLYHDPLPRMIFEYGSYALPVAASDVGGIGEVIENTRTGFLFSAGDSAALSRILSRALCDFEIFAAAGLELHRRIRERFLVRHAADQRLALYRKLLY